MTPRPLGSGTVGVRARDQYGFTYLALLFAVAIAGVVLAGTGVLWRTDAVRERETELLFIGGEMQRALESFLQSSPPDARRYPRSLEELLEDRRGPLLRRHLRRLYVDPFTGRADWMLVRAPDGTITAVHSVSEGVPIRRANPFGAFAFPIAKTYRDWVFEARAGGGRLGAGARVEAGSASGPAPGAASMAASQDWRALVGGPAEPPRPQVVNVVAGPAAPPEPVPEKPPSANCITQRANDGKTCQTLRASGDIVAAGTCLISATQRFVACERGGSVPPLRLP